MSQIRKPDIDPTDHPALLLGMRIIKGAYEATESLESADGSVGEIASRKGGVLIIGYSVFFYHWIDRIAWQMLGARRDYLMDRIRDALIPALADAIRPEATEEQRKADEVGLDETFEGFQRKFARFAGPQEASDRLEGTLPWEFAVWLAEYMECSGEHEFTIRAAFVGLEGAAKLDVVPVLKDIDPTVGSVKDGKIVVPCQACPERMRLPVGVGKIRATCPTCQHEQVLTI